MQIERAVSHNNKRGLSGASEVGDPLGYGYADTDLDHGICSSPPPPKIRRSDTLLADVMPFFKDYWQAGPGGSMLPTIEDGIMTVKINISKATPCTAEEQNLMRTRDAIAMGRLFQAASNELLLEIQSAYSKITNVTGDCPGNFAEIHFGLGLSVFR
jgi:hypothetical protein